MPRRRQRFGGAGGAATREFERRRRENFRDEWTTWLLITAAIGGFAAWSLLTGGGLAGRALAAMAGVLIGLVGFAWSIGGHVSAVRWLIGAAGERETAKQIEKLGAAWHCEHDLEQPRGNWDHVLVGPPGVFLLDSKSLSGTVAAGGDALRRGV